MFIGREKELKILNEQINKKSSSTLIYGKRKIGKTTLIKEACKATNKTFVYYECIKSTLDINVKLLINELKKSNIISNSITFNDNPLINLFKYLNELNKEIIIVIDEYPYLKQFENDKYIDSIFQNIIDNYLLNINLIISGSHIGMMKDLLTEKNALFGRFNSVIELNELDYYSSSLFYSDLSAYDKVAFYSVFGGSPYINEEINPKLSLKQNIINLILNQNNKVFIYLDSLLLTDYANKENIDRILSFLKNGKNKYSEIESVVDPNKTGNLSKRLKPLLDMKIIEKMYPINKKNDAKKVYYSINDNILRFYYTYIYENKSSFARYDAELFYDNFISDSINIFIALHFEKIIIDYFWKLVNKGVLKNVIDIGPYYYDDKVNKKNGEFDVCIKYKNNKYDVIEVKYLKNKLDVNTVNKELEQIKNISELEIDKIGFVSINGFNNDINNLDIKIDGNDIYNV